MIVFEKLLFIFSFPSLKIKKSVSLTCTHKDLRTLSSYPPALNAILILFLVLFWGGGQIFKSILNEKLFYYFIILNRDIVEASIVAQW